MQSKEFQPLRECPFCGGEAEATEYNDSDYTIMCKNCHAEIGWREKAEAIAAWNRRADHLPDATKMVSNADRIRSMSDEEFARWLVDATVCERVCDEDEYCHGNECVKRVTDWLQQPAKEVHNGK